MNASEMPMALQFVPRRVLVLVLMALASVGLTASSVAMAPEPNPIPVRWQLDLDVGPLRVASVDTPVWARCSTST